MENQYMKLELVRTYLPGGTNGVLQLNVLALCHTIELPWKENKPGISSIPEGEYQLVRRYSKKSGGHLLVKGVVNRSLILLRPANDAIKELRGCIAPVSTLTGPGKVIQSRVVFLKLVKLVYKAIDRQETIFLNITSTGQSK